MLFTKRTYIVALVAHALFHDAVLTIQNSVHDHAWPRPSHSHRGHNVWLLMCEGRAWERGCTYFGHLRIVKCARSLIINGHTYNWFIITYVDGSNNRHCPRDFRNKHHKEIFGWFLQIIIVDANTYASFVRYETECGRSRDIVVRNWKWAWS